MTSVLEPPPYSVAGRSPAVPPRNVWLREVLAVLGSMQGAVILLLYLGLLTFLGTVAQVRMSAYDVQKIYFEAWWAPGAFGVPIPGGLPTMIALFVNLLVGGVIRVRWHKANIGILIAHGGMLLLLLAGWVKYSMSHSGMVSMFEYRQGQREPEYESTFVSFNEWEVALVRQDGDQVVERAVPAEVLGAAADGGRVELRGHGLPCTITVHDWLENCEPHAATPGMIAGKPVVDGAFLETRPVVTRQREANIAGCYVDVADAKGTVQRGILWGYEHRPMYVNDMPWRFQLGDATWGLILRRKTYELPFALKLDRFSKEDHPGSGMARDFSSYVTVAEGDSKRSVRIFMNNPLRQSGHVVYQTQFGQDPRTGRFYSLFEIGCNPSDKWPEWSCYVIAVGLLLHFGRKLLLYIDAQARRRAEETA